MRYEFPLPDLGEGIHEAEIRRWLVPEGQPVQEDQPLVEVETDKAVVEIPSPASGTLLQHGAPEGQVVRVGAVLAVLDVKRPPTTLVRPPQEPLGVVGFPPETGKGPEATPAVRRLARQLGVDLQDVRGSGPGGRITEDDVLRASRAGEVARVPLRGLRRQMAQRMAQAASIPQVTAFEEVGASALVELRGRVDSLAQSRGLRLTYLPFVVRAVVLTLPQHPFLNASLHPSGDFLLLHRAYHIGVATATPEGLLVPVLRHADRLGLWEMAAQLQQLVEEARRRTLPREHLVGSTFTITNYGALGGLVATPLLTPPEVAILGVGRIQERPVAVEGRVDVRPVLTLALTFDHRVLDGEQAGRFLHDLVRRLTDPWELFAELRAVR